MNALTLELANGIIASTFSKSPEMKLKPVGTPFCGAIRAKGSTLSTRSLGFPRELGLVQTWSRGILRGRVECCQIVTIG